MGNPSNFRSSHIITALSLPLLLTSCTTSPSDIFAHPVATAVNTPAKAVTTPTTVPAVPGWPLRPLVGDEADHFRRGVDQTMAVWKADHFVFVAPPDSEALPHVADLLKQTHGAFYEVFGGMKDKLEPIRDPLIWLVFDGREDYERYAQAADGMDMSWAKAYYSAQTNRVAIDLKGEDVPAAPALEDKTLRSANPAAGAAANVAIAATATINGKLGSQITHEAAHQLAFNSGLQKRGVMYPLWVSEGLAANFELDSKGRLGPQAENALRTRHVTAAKAENRLVPLDKWVSLTRVPFGRPAQISAVYGQSWAFFRFLHEHRRDQLQGYLVHVAQQQPGRRSDEAMSKEFVQFFGDPQKLSEPWDSYLTKLGDATGRN